LRRLVIANWKMNLDLMEATLLAQGSVKIAENHHELQVIIAPSLPWLVPIREIIKFTPPNFALASQVVSQYETGAYTGEVAAKQLKGIVTYSLVGHSERRRYHHESGPIIRDQIKQLLDNKITPVICFGEMHEAKQKTFSPQITLDFGHDLAGLSEHEIAQCLFAYEPLWAIGTGNPATPDYVAKAVAHVKAWAKEKWTLDIPVLYGGSVNEDNAETLGQVRNLDGLLVGGASINLSSFKKVCSLYSSSV
jgi:triosephosphate isomerase (TIM)